MEIVENFNSMYGDMVDAFIQKLYDDFQIIELHGRMWNILDSYDPICITKSPRYVIPPRIIELLRVGNIAKPGAHGLKIGISTKLKWNSYIVEMVFGFPLECFDDFGCYGCGEIKVDLNSIWSHGEHMLCETCYYSCENAHDYQRHDVCDFNAVDWVEFMKDVHGKFYVNCNPESHVYGFVAVLSFGLYAGKFDIVGDVDLFVELIEHWLMDTKEQNLNQALEFLDDSYGCDSIAGHIAMYDPSVDRNMLTPRELLSNPNKWKHVGVANVSTKVNKKLVHKMVKPTSFSYELQTLINTTAVTTE